MITFKSIQVICDFGRRTDPLVETGMVQLRSIQEAINWAWISFRKGKQSGRDCALDQSPLLSFAWQ